MTRNKLYKITIVISGMLMLMNAPMHAQDTLRFQAQDRDDTLSRIEVLGTYDDQAVYFRWAPYQAADWNSLIYSGYRVEKFLMDDTRHLPIMPAQESFTVKPWEKQRFQPYMSSDRKYLLTAAQCMYGEWESVQSEGLNITGRADELSNRYSMAMLAADLDWEAAEALGLAWKDSHVMPGHTYLYVVSPIDTQMQVIPGYVSVQTVEDVIPPPLIQHILEHEGTVTIQWDRADHELYYSAYYIERSADGITFNSLLDIPFTGGETEAYPSYYFSYADSVVNYTPYYYRLRGVTPFGKMSPPSIVRKAMARDRTPAPAPADIDITTRADTREIIISWTSQHTPDLDHYKIFRSGRIDGAWEDVSNRDQDAHPARFKDYATDIWKLQYYIIASVDTAGNLNRSVPVVCAFRDTVSPAAPTGLTGSIDTNGIVTLRWKRGVEEDLRGYYVYMSNQEDHHYTNLTRKPLTDTTWHDTITLRTFTEHIYYKIAAVDFHAHFSDFSSPVRLTRPDTIPPFPPHITHYRVEQDFILLHLKHSDSKDVQSHHLYRRTSDQPWLQVTAYDFTTTEFRDRDIEEGKIYEYKAVAIDDAGLESRHTDIVRIKAVDLSVPEPPVINTCQRLDNGDIALAWSASSGMDLTYQLYRSENGGPFLTVDKIREALQFTDKQADAERHYRYKIRTLWRDGRKSDFSNEAGPHN